MPSGPPGGDPARMGMDGLAGLRGPNRCGVSTPPRTARPCAAIAPALRGTARGLKRYAARGGPCRQRPSPAAPIETLPRPRHRRRLRLGSAVARCPSIGLRLPPRFRPLHRPALRARAFAAAAPVRAGRRRWPGPCSPAGLRVCGGLCAWPPGGGSAAVPPGAATYGAALSPPGPAPLPAPARAANGGGRRAYCPLKRTLHNL